MDQVLAEAVREDSKPSMNIRDTLQSWRRKWTTKEGLLGDYDYAFLFTPSYPFQDYISRRRGIEPVHRDQPFFSVDAEIPVVLGLLLGLQHSLSMLAGVISPPIIISGIANLDSTLQEYLVSVSLIVSGLLLSLIHI